MGKRTLKLTAIYVAFICFLTFSVPVTAAAGDNWFVKSAKSFVKHIKKCEVKIQGATTKQWKAAFNPDEAITNPNLTSGQKKALAWSAVGAAAITAAIIIKNNNDDDPVPVKKVQGGDI